MIYGNKYHRCDEVIKRKQFRISSFLVIMVILFSLVTIEIAIVGAEIATIQPSSFTDVDTKWSTEGQAYDGVNATSATEDNGRISYDIYWQSWDDTNLGTINSITIRILMDLVGLSDDVLNIEIWVDGNKASEAYQVNSGNDGTGLDITIADVTEPIGGGWSWADVGLMEVRFDGVKNTGFDPVSDYEVFEIWAIIDYTGVQNDAPIVDSFDTVAIIYSASYELVNITVGDVNGIDELKNATLTLEDGVILQWVNATDTFSENADPSSYCTVQNTTSLLVEINGTHIELAFNISLTSGYQRGNSNASAEVYDTSNDSGVDSKENWFIFAIFYSDSISSGLGFIATTTRIGAYLGTIVSGLSIGSIVSRIGNYISSVSSGLNIASSISRIGKYISSVSSDLNIISSISRIGKYLSVMSSDFSIGSLVSRMVTFISTPSSDLSIGSLVDRIRTTLRITSSDLKVEGLVGRMVTAIRIMSSNLNIESLVSRTTILSRIIAVELNIGVLFDHSLDGVAKTYEAIIANLNIGGMIDRVASYFSTASSNLNVISSVSRVGSYISSTFSSFSMGSSVSRMVTFISTPSSDLNIIVSISRVGSYISTVSSDISIGSLVSRIRTSFGIVSSNLNIEGLVSRTITMFKTITTELNIGNLFDYSLGGFSIYNESINQNVVLALEISRKYTSSTLYGSVLGMGWGRVLSLSNPEMVEPEIEEGFDFVPEGINMPFADDILSKASVVIFAGAIGVVILGVGSELDSESGNKIRKQVRRVIRG